MKWKWFTYSEIWSLLEEYFGSASASLYVNESTERRSIRPAFVQRTYFFDRDIITKVISKSGDVDEISFSERADLYVAKVLRVGYVLSIRISRIEGIKLDQYKRGSRGLLKFDSHNTIRLSSLDAEHHLYGVFSAIAEENENQITESVLDLCARSERVNGFISELFRVASLRLPILRFLSEGLSMDQKAYCSLSIDQLRNIESVNDYALAVAPLDAKISIDLSSYGTNFIEYILRPLLLLHLIEGGWKAIEAHLDDLEQAYLLLSALGQDLSVYLCLKYFFQSQIFSGLPYDDCTEKSSIRRAIHYYVCGSNVNAKIDLNITTQDQLRDALKRRKSVIKDQP